jgi:LmbE family N-acetylglucosaminyl deacetylase
MSMAEVVPPADGLDRILVVSPHFDDAVLGASSVLARHPGSTVVTVLGGRPPAYPAEPTWWDALGGFVAGDDVVALRREEDRAAMATLTAQPVWLEFADHQYLPKADRPTPEQVAPALEEAILAAGPTSVFFPFGLANPDHDLTHRAARLVLARHPDLAWYCYEDGGYANIPGLLAWRIAALFRSGLWPTPAVVPVEPSIDRKRAALECYRSQLPPLRADHLLDARLDAPAPEQFWRLAPPPAGWEGLVEAAG